MILGRVLERSTWPFPEPAPSLVPEPGHGEVLLRMKASTICGSDIRCIYHEHLGKGPEGYQGVVAGHEPCGQIVKAGPFYKAEEEHQNYLQKHPRGYTCHFLRPESILGD